MYLPSVGSTERAMEKANIVQIRVHNFQTEVFWSVEGAVLCDTNHAWILGIHKRQQGLFKAHQVLCGETLLHLGDVTQGI